MPFWYPANLYEFPNGTRFNGTSFPGSSPFAIGFQGHVDETTYQKLIKEKHLGRNTPIDFHGYNDPSDSHGFFPFWSSDAYTYATTLLALSKFNNIPSLNMTYHTELI